MKSVAMLFLCCVVPLTAQVEFPGNPTVGPKKYTTRKTGGTIDPGAKLEEKVTEGETVRYVSYIVLHDVRIWLTVDGKSTSAKLIAFEELTVDAVKGDPAPEQPKAPERPTAIKNGKARLLVGKNAYEVPMERFVPGDRELIEGVQASIDRKASEGR